MINELETLERKIMDKHIEILSQDNEQDITRLRHEYDSLIEKYYVLVEEQYQHEQR